jgi:hypothetical protein
MSWQSRVILRDGESLKHERSSTQGFMQETDVDTYSIVQADGSVVGSVTVTDHTAVRGFKRTVNVVQKDTNGKVVVDESFLPE